MQSQLLVLPLTGLPQTLKSIFSILLPSHEWSAVILHMDFTWREQFRDSCLLFLEFLAFSFFYFMVHCQNAIRHSQQQLQRGSPPRHPSATGEDKQSFFMCFLSFIISKWDAAIEACSVEIRNVPRVLYCYQESAGVYKHYVYTHTHAHIYTHTYIFTHSNT